MKLGAAALIGILGVFSAPVSACPDGPRVYLFQIEPLPKIPKNAVQLRVDLFTFESNPQSGKEYPISLADQNDVDVFGKKINIFFPPSMCFWDIVAPRPENDPESIDGHYYVYVTGYVDYSRSIPAYGMFPIFYPDRINRRAGEIEEINANEDEIFDKDPVAAFVRPFRYGPHIVVALLIIGATILGVQFRRRKPNETAR